MPRALILCPFPPERSLPLQREGSWQLQYLDDDGVLHGGYSCVGNVTAANTDCMCWVDTSPETLDTLAGLDGYSVVEELAELDENGDPIDTGGVPIKGGQVRQPQQTMAAVDLEPLTARLSISEQEYRMAGGTVLDAPAAEPASGDVEALVSA